MGFETCRNQKIKKQNNILKSVPFVVICHVILLQRPRRDEVTEEWRRFHNEELNDLYCSPNIVRVIKSRRMRWDGHVARMGEERGCIGSWWGNRRERATGET